MSLHRVFTRNCADKGGGCGKLAGMQILAVDIGTGTQDIFLYNSSLDMENNFKLVVPSPTMIVHHQIKQATRQGVPILLSGVTMGGGPSAWAAEAHMREGLKVYATSEAARTFNDDLLAVKKMGVEILSEDEAAHLPDSVLHLELQDFDFSSISKALCTFGVELDHLAAITVGVFDHGNAPADVSGRKFRFDYLDERIRKLNRLSAFAYRRDDIPTSMTRMQAVVNSARGIDIPLVVMDTAPAAVLGASLDPFVAGRHQKMIANVGNFHTLAFRLGPGGIEGLFEHHTGFLDLKKLDHLLLALADGTLQHEDVFGDQGHGALVYDSAPLKLGEGAYDVVITGPRRSIYYYNATDNSTSKLRPYFPAPFGDMMISGCFGLLAATADVMPEIAEPICASLSRAGASGIAPWEID
ncbi:MAG TPA: DUF1786 family protein [Anaerolineales bacterium]